MDTNLHNFIEPVIQDIELKDVYVICRKLFLQNEILKTELETVRREIQNIQKVTNCYKLTNQKPRSINVKEWLNTNMHPTVTFGDWLQGLPFNEKLMELVIKHDFIEGCWRNMYEHIRFNSAPICAFIQKPGVIYIYTKKDGEFTWCELLPSFGGNYLVDLLKSKLSKLFYAWQEENREELKLNDEYRNKFNDYSAKCMALNFAEDRILKDLKKRLYDYLKRDIASI